jgi:hypothetical protein|tara:strand:+ start:3053 stop:3193 length:141 start_codon:yes stop_codon:yes gene_type:complete
MSEVIGVGEQELTNAPISKNDAALKKGKFVKPTPALLAKRLTEMNL